MKRIVITGANAGIGLATAKFLAPQNELILVCRTQRKGETAAASIRLIAPRTPVTVLPVDLHDFASVQLAAMHIQSKFDSIDVLINNAGYYPKRIEYIGQTEKTLYASHLGHMLLTLLLLPTLEMAAEPRIINVSSALHWRGNARHFFRQIPGLSTFQAYADAKLANILFTMALNQKMESRVRAFALHPGVVATNFDRDIRVFFKFLIEAAKPLFYLTPEQGAATSVYLANAPTSAIQAAKACYFANSRPTQIQNAGATAANADDLWQRSYEVLLPHLSQAATI